MIDMTAWFAWAVRLNEEGFINFYSDAIWTNYSPGYLYILAVLDFIRTTLNFNENYFYFLLKIPAIIADLILAYLVLKLFLKNESQQTKSPLFLSENASFVAFIHELKFMVFGTQNKISKKLSLIATALILFNPAIVFNSSVWGQIESILTLFLYLSIYFLTLNKPLLSSIFIALAILIKPQAIALTPVYLFYLFRHPDIRTFAKLTVPALTLIFILSLPFFSTNPYEGIGKLLLKMIDDYPFISLFAYNFWGIIGFWINDSTSFQSLSYKTWGYLLLVFYWLVIIYFYLKKGISLFSIGLFALLSFFFLPTRAHERYLYPALLFLLIVAFQTKNKLLIFLYLILSLIHLLNLYYVYVYYNEFYLNLDKFLYSPTIYNFLNDYSKLVSLFSTLTFLAISVIILKVKYVKE